MLKTVVIAKNPFEPETWEETETADIRALLVKQFAEWPTTARIYHEHVAESCDVTPTDDAGVERLAELPGPFYVVVYPEAAVIPYIIAAIVVGVVALAVLGRPTAGLTLPNSSPPSPNNDLAARQNKARPLGRIPDIFGQVRSTPDLLMVCYSEYLSNTEYEHAYMCIGRGWYEVEDACDDSTPIDTIDGAGVMIYPPGFNCFDTSAQTFGQYYAPQIYEVCRSVSVNGQDLLTTGVAPSITNNLILPRTGGILESQSGGPDLTTLSLVAGDRITLAGAFLVTWTEFDAGIGAFRSYSVNPVFSGTYTVASVSASQIHLSDYASVNSSSWTLIASHPVVGGGHVVVTKILSSTGPSAGPFVLKQQNIDAVWANVIATNGLYKIDSGGTVTAVDVDLEMTVQPQDIHGSATGAPEVFTTTMTGRSDKGTVAFTWKVTPTIPGPCAVSIRRTSNSPVSSQVSDAVKWRDLYGMGGADNSSTLGNVTTCYAVTKATAGALSVKERKLNMLVTRMVAHRVSGTTFGSLAATKSMAPILCAVALDEFIGNRVVGEIDVDSIYDTAAAVAAYFGTDEAAQFCYTFDGDNISYEETVAQIAQAAFCTAYRQGRQMRLHFEKKTPDSSLLFGHRNKLPGSELRTVTFGALNGYDGVEYTYTSPDDDAQITLYIPGHAVAPKQITGVGVRSYYQAYFHAWREWQKLAYGNTTTEFIATEEARLVLRTERVLVADNTRSGTQDGEVVAQNVLELQLSQKVAFAVGKTYHLFLQGADGSVESIAISPGSNAYNVVLAHAPAVALSIGESASYRTLYWMVANDDVRPQAFLVTHREPDTAWTEKVTAVNYDDRYYAKDQDLVLEVIDADPDTGGKKHIM